MINTLREQLCELLVIENLERASWRNFAHRARMEAVMVVAVARLNEDGRIRQAFSVNLAADVVQMDTLADVSPRVLYRRVAVHVGQLTETKPVGVVARVCKTVHDDRVRLTVEHLADSAVELVVGD